MKTRLSGDSLLLASQLLNERCLCNRVEAALAIAGEALQRTHVLFVKESTEFISLRFFGSQDTPAATQAAPAEASTAEDRQERPEEKPAVAEERPQERSESTAKAAQFSSASSYKSISIIYL